MVPNGGHADKNEIQLAMEEEGYGSKKQNER